MPTPYYRPRLKNTKNIDWKKLLGLISIIEDTTRTNLITQATASYLEGRLDEAICTPDNPTPSVFNKVELKKKLEKIRIYLGLPI